MRSFDPIRFTCQNHILLLLRNPNSSKTSIRVSLNSALVTISQKNQTYLLPPRDIDSIKESTLVIDSIKESTLVIDLIKDATLVNCY